MAMTLGAWLAVGSALGCEGGLVPGKSFESPFSFPARLVGALPLGTRPLASVLWTDPWEVAPDRPMPADWSRSSVAAAASALEGNLGMGADVDTLGPFTWDVFRPPPREALVEIPSPDGTEVAVMALGELVIIDDQDGDGTFFVDERGRMRGSEVYLAGSAQVLVYLAKAFSPDVAKTFDLAPVSDTGYFLLSYACSGRALREVTLAGKASMEPQTSVELVERRSCFRTHSR